MMDCLMGIDIGSTRTKCVIFDIQGRAVATGETDTVLSYEEENPTWSYWDPDELWNNTVSAIRQAVSKMANPAAIRAVAATSFSCDIALLGENYESLYYIKSWHCPRVQPQIDKWLREVGAKDIFLATGRQPAKMDTVYYLDWLSEHKKEVLEKTRKILLISDFINFKLSGRTVTDYSMANTTSLLDLRKKDWHKGYVERANFSVDKMQSLAGSGTVLGKITKDAAEITGLNEDVVIVLGGHDNECAAFAAGIMDDRSIVDIVGTWEIVLASGETTSVSEQMFEFGLSTNFHVIKDHFVTIGYEVSGYLLEWAKANFFGLEEKECSKNNMNIWGYINDKIRDIPTGSNGIVVLPFMSGRSCIYPDPASSCTILGLKDFHEKYDIMHSILEGICMQTRELVEGIERSKQHVYPEMICVGGPTRNHLLMQMKADVSGKKIKAMDMEHGTALGAAMIAGVGAGIYGDFRQAIDAIKESQTYKTYNPDMNNKAQYDTVFDYYKEAYKVISKLNGVEFQAK